MKPKFALDLSHEGINLLHRSKGGWSLVGSVELDDPEMGAHLADLRRRAAALESGGVTCKIIIPNSQVLYTTLEAPGPDDISREVQIRSGLDGLTPYPVGELVFDWRAAGERARVAVLARETMDEAETFAVEHRFNPVSFVARSAQGEFSGEPFFGKTRSATKILGPTERVEPDASPVPRKPPAMETRPFPGPGAEPSTAWGADAGLGHTSQPDPQVTPHSPGDLAWQPPAEPARRDETPPQASDPTPDQVPEPFEVAQPEPDPGDDPFAELDAIQAELSGDPDAAPTFRSRTNRPQPRPDTRRQRPDEGGDQTAPPPLAPFPPTSDEAEALPAPAHPARKTPGSGKSSAAGKIAPSSQPEPARQRPPGAQPGRRAAPVTDRDRTVPSASEQTPPHTSSRPAPQERGRPATPAAKDDTPAQPGVAFSTRRGGSGETTTATPTARKAPSEPAREDGSHSPARPATSTPAHPTGHAPRQETTSSDQRRADMADALSRPLPTGPVGAGAEKSPEKPEAPEKPGARNALSDAVRGAAGGFRSFGQRRTPGKDDAKPSGSSMTALMRGAGSSEARISPDRFEDEPDLLAPDVAASDAKSGQAATVTAKPGAGATAGETSAPVPAAAAKKPAPMATTDTAKPTVPSPNADKALKPATEPAGKPAPALAPDKPRILSRAATAKPDTPKEPVSEAEALTVFGARRVEETRGGRKYLGIVLTLLLLLAMAVIAMWSSFFVDDTEPAVFNPDDAAVAPEDPAPDTAPADDTTAAPVPDDQPQEAATEQTAPETDATPTPTPTPEVLTQTEAEARYAETQIWQRAPETLGEPFTPGLDMGPVAGPGTARGATADPAATAAPELPAAPASTPERATPLPPPPADTVFALDENGLVNPSPDGTVSPTGIIVFEGPPEVVPPARPAPPALPEPAPDDAAIDDAALEQAVEQAVEAAAALVPDAAPAEVVPEAPDLRPEPRPEDVPDALPAPDTAAPDATDPDGDARLDGTPATPPGAVPEAQIETVAADAASIEAAVDAIASSFVDATDLAVARSLKPTRRPPDMDQIVNAAMARAAAAPPAAQAAPAAPATTTPAIPTSASVANQATTPNALNLREINLLGISGPSNARRALVRMENGRYVTVKVGDRLDGGRVTSITSDGLTYQKGSRNFSLQLLPLG